MKEGNADPTYTSIKMGKGKKKKKKKMMHQKKNEA